MTSRSNSIVISVRLLIRVACGLILIGHVAPAQQAAIKPPPTHAAVPYGPHSRNVLDFWQAEGDRPTSLVIYIHGGGFRNGSKDGLGA